MIISELDAATFPDIRTLPADRVNMEIRAVIEGNNPGQIFVDQLDNPTTAAVWPQGLNVLFLVGDEANDGFNRQLDDLLDRVITPRAQAMGMASIKLSGTTNRWQDAIATIIGHRQPAVSVQCIYTLQQSGTEDQGADTAADEAGGGGAKGSRIPGNRGETADDGAVHIVPMNTDLLLSRNLVNPDFPRSRVLRFWPSLERFCDLGIGYAVIYGDTVAALCFSALAAGNVHAVHVETLPDYRRQGYARAAAERLVAKAVSRGIIPYWDALKTNTASCNLAASLGLTKDWEYVLYEMRLPG